MDIRQMDILLKIRNTLNFNRAAEDIGISQPSLSYQVKQIEQEIGFTVFERSGKGVFMTPAGEQFCLSLFSIREEYRRILEQCQNMSGRVRQDIRIGLPTRSALKLLPEVIRKFSEICPDVSVTPVFHQYGDFTALFSGRTDLEFAATGDLGRIHGVDEHLLYESRIYLIVRDDDFLASRETVCEEDLNGMTLMVGGGSPPLLKSVQQRIIQSGRVRYFNSNDHDTTLVNVASGRGVCLAPGLLNGDDPHYKWIPFDCPERFECALLSRSDDGRESVAELIRLFEEAYRGYEGPL